MTKVERPQAVKPQTEGTMERVPNLLYGARGPKGRNALSKPHKKQLK